MRCLKRAVGPPLVVKYATDIAELCYALKHHRPVPRTLLKNGKRSATTFIASWLRCTSIASASDAVVSPISLSPTLQPNLAESDGLCSQPSGDINMTDASHFSDTGAAITVLMREVSSLRHDIIQLRSEMLNRQCSFFMS